MTQKDSTKLNTLELIANRVKNDYLFIENSIVKGYKAIENGVVNGFNAVNDAITLKLFGRDGETSEETKVRIDANVRASKVHSKEIVVKNMRATMERIKNTEIK